MAVDPDLLIAQTDTIRSALKALDRTGSGIVLLLDGEDRFVRTVTDGDLRRLILAGSELDDSLRALPEWDSLTVDSAVSEHEAIALMDRRRVDHLPVLDAGRRVVALMDRRAFGSRIELSTPHMGLAERQYVDEAFETNWIAPLGPNVDAFEREIAEYVGSPHAAALSSGTAALHLGLRLLDVVAGDKVFCSSFTFIASASPIVYQGAEPVFLDADRISWNMCPLALERAFETARREGWMPKAVVVVNLYGQSADYDRLIEICDKYGVPILEDAAESLGARYKSTPSGRFGRLAAFSFNGNKIITTSGGGMLVSDDGDAIARARYLSTQARQPAPHYEHTEIGYNYRMSNILAGVGRGQLEVLDDRVASRRAVFDRYRERLSTLPGLDWMPEPDWSFSTRWLSTLTLDPMRQKLPLDTIRGRLAEDLIETRPLWKPMHLQPVFAGTRYITAGTSSVSDDLFANGLCLPSGSNLTDGDLDRICDAIVRIAG